MIYLLLTISGCVGALAGFIVQFRQIWILVVLEVIIAVGSAFLLNDNDYFSQTIALVFLCITASQLGFFVGLRINSPR
jgi:hypothetical protein